ncbi:MAG: rhamnogalacturonan lyase [Bacteroidaceae bacterium]|nr:rhamnogalacturonan lyase [Bacteroidaceae bacterium]
MDRFITVAIHTYDKAIALRNVTLTGTADEPLYTADHYLQAAQFVTAQGEQLSMLELLGTLSNGATADWPDKLYGQPSDFQLTPADGCTATVEYSNNIATIIIQQEGATVFRCAVRFAISNTAPRPKPVALNRGLVAVNLSAGGGSGNLISWRYRESDDNRVKFKLWRGTKADAQAVKLNSGNYIYSKTNFRDASGTSAHYYRLEVYDLSDNLLETMVCRAWGNQSMEIPTSTPTDERGLGATYTPNDAAFCDMDGDGEYEVILKWEPSNAKDAASDGTTSSYYIDCYKLSGTQLWRVNIGPNIRSGAHTSPFLCWDFDGDGFGEMISKTAPGTVDGEGNYVVMPGDDPLQNCLSGRGKPDKGPEYVTVFDGFTGAALATMPYHTKYGDVSTSFWGDEKQNRSERYLACVAYTDGTTPSAILCRGYYSGASLGAYDWDGMNLSLRWLHRSATSGKELWGQGAHFVVTADVDADGKDEIVYGSATLDHDGKTTLYRTGLGHGDALHVGDFDWDNPGLEVFMPHEKSPYGYDMHDAKTGTLLVHATASGDTGRGLAANFDATHDGAEIIAANTAAMMDCKGEVIANSWALGNSGAGINARLYWDGDPYDEFFDKSLIGHWNGTGFDRLYTNGGMYFPGTLNNGTKYNPCVIGDLLGDWREEMITWNSSNNALIVTTTNIETDYRIEHLMDNRQYAEAVANQNCAYNQPPHLSYDPALRFSITVDIPASGWAPVYLPHAMQLSKNAQVFYGSGFDANVDTLKIKAAPNTIPAGTGVLVHGAPGTKVTFRPAASTGSSLSDSKILGDAYLPVEVESTTSATYYVWDERPQGLGFYRVDRATIPVGTLYMKVTLSSARNEEHYLIGGTVATGIETLSSETADDTATTPHYDLGGRRVSPAQRGIHIVGTKKVLH